MNKMKKLITILLILCIYANVSAQKVSGIKETKEVQLEWKYFNPDSILRVHYDLKNDTAKIFYWVYRIENDKIIYQKRYHNCYVPFKKKDLQPLETEFNAWINEKYDL